jgi:hypothetical protein
MLTNSNHPHVARSDESVPESRDNRVVARTSVVCDDPYVVRLTLPVYVRDDRDPTTTT